ncbi:hypothetical protein SEA_ZETA1847_44 [Microbacterium phage Zeta1847]|uniref:Uncharacterized protein n=1 Tax=Microbacterium phage Zeta1847 TaxID=2201444 RepID=A0A2Z4QAX2_9CAUD|nr:hypothetical protein HOT46_gp44 [Microbacterium phage Zeta1847]AWY06678.1 hypothetical protein SEA_ZETA1847_44 [Microbacterium phage Zeta1847]
MVSSACACGGPGCKLEADSPRHGKRTGYAKHGCRCDPCTDAQADYQARWAAANRDRVAALNAASYARHRDHRLAVMRDYDARRRAERLAA